MFACVQFLERCFSPTPQVDEQALHEPHGKSGSMSGSRTKENESDNNIEIGLYSASSMKKLTKKQAFNKKNRKVGKMKREKVEKHVT